MFCARMKREIDNMLYIIITLVIGLILLYFLLTYNKLVTLRNRMLNQKSQVDVELKTRFDLIPNLVEVVKGYAAHEKTTLEEVISARNRYVSSGNVDEQLASDDSLETALTRLYVLTENYPNLKADKFFLDLQHSLGETEQKIRFARQFYNDTVYLLNTNIEVFPASMVASLTGFKKEAFFKASDSERENQKISI